MEGSGAVLKLKAHLNWPNSYVGARQLDFQRGTKASSVALLSQVLRGRRLPALTKVRWLLTPW